LIGASNCRRSPLMVTEIMTGIAVAWRTEVHFHALPGLWQPAGRALR